MYLPVSGAGHTSGGAAYVDELGELIDEVHEDEGVLRDDPAQLGRVSDVVVGAGEERYSDDAKGDDGAKEEIILLPWCLVTFKCHHNNNTF